MLFYVKLFLIEAPALKFHGGASVLSEIVFLGWKFFRIAKLENINFYF